MTAAPPPDDALFILPDPEEGPRGLPEVAGGWPDDPVAQVLLDSPVPHLDREFDYLVPREMDADARPGVRVKVRFGHRDVTGWLISRTAEPSTGAKLQPLRRVVSAEQVLAPEVLALARAAARRYAGTTADVLRLALPPRVAKVEKELREAQVVPEATGQSGVTDRASGAEETSSEPASQRAQVWSELSGAEAFWTAVTEGGHPRSAVVLPSAHGAWDAAVILADSAALAVSAGRGAVVVVPDQRDLDRLCRALDERVGPEGYARLTAEDGPTPRYRSFLQLLQGSRRIAVGTRSAIWAPVQDLGLILVWNDGDSLLAEPRAPYAHTREVALLRSELDGAALMFASTARTPEIQRLVESGWLQELAVDRPGLHAATPRVVSTADSWESERDPFLQRARLPQAAWRAAREALEGRHGEPGPVLVQVARSGFIPAVLCQDCGTPARCQACAGPLGYPDRHAAARSELACRWCGRRERRFACPECGGQRLRAGSRGVDRTAEELGRAFPHTPVLSSSGDHILSTVTDRPALVVATTGAEPVAEGGYAAALLLDGDAQLQREGLRVPEQVLAHWFAAASLVRSRQDGGAVVVTASQQEVVGALVRMDPAGFASRQLEERRQLHLPPGARMAEVTGPAGAVEAFLTLVDEALAVQPQRPGAPAGAHALPWIGPVPVEDPRVLGTAEAYDGVRHRALLFFPYARAEQVVGALRAARSAASARREHEPVRVRVDPADLP